MLAEALEAPVLLCKQVPFESLRERMGAGNQLVFAATYAGLEGRA